MDPVLQAVSLIGIIITTLASIYGLVDNLKRDTLRADLVADYERVKQDRDGLRRRNEELERENALYESILRQRGIIVERPEHEDRQGGVDLTGSATASAGRDIVGGNAITIVRERGETVKIEGDNVLITGVEREKPTA